MRVVRSDADLLQGLLSADQASQSRAVDQVLAKIKPVIVNHVRANSGSREDGLAIATDTVVELWKAAVAGKYTVQSNAQMTTWCFGTARNLWLKELRRRRRFDNGGLGAGNEPVETHTPEAELMESEVDPQETARQQNALRAFDRLGADCQQLFRMDADKKKPEEIMLAMGWKDQDYVRLKRFRCRKAFNQFHEAERNSMGAYHQPARP